MFGRRDSIGAGSGRLLPTSWAEIEGAKRGTAVTEQAVSVSSGALRVLGCRVCGLVASVLRVAGRTATNLGLLSPRNRERA